VGAAIQEAKKQNAERKLDKGKAMKFNQEQKAFIISALVYALCLGFVIGYASCIFVNR
jgi:F0F1-type ATP synthase assembly protein I